MKEIQISEQDAKFHLNRLDSMLATKWEYYAGNLGPIKEWGSGETKEYRVNTKNGVEIKEVAVTLPLERPRSGREKGLLWALNAGITSEVGLLIKAGLGDVVRERLIFDSKMPGGNPDKYNDERCSGK